MCRLMLMKAGLLQVHLQFPLQRKKAAESRKGMVEKSAGYHQVLNAGKIQFWTVPYRLEMKRPEN